MPHSLAATGADAPICSSDGLDGLDGLGKVLFARAPDPALRGDAARAGAYRRFALDLTEKLVDALARGFGPWRRYWEPAFGNDLPFNPVTGREFGGLNLVKLLSTPYEDPRWLTLRQGSALGARLKAGSKGERLLMWRDEYKRARRDEEGRALLDEDGKPLYERVKRDRPFFARFHVFNAQCFENLPDFESSFRGYDWDPIERCAALLKKSQARIEHAGDGGPLYDPDADVIKMPDKRLFRRGEDYYGALFHELAHWTGHRSRLARDFCFDQNDPLYAQEEVRAEMASMLLSRRLGIPHNPENHVAYLGAWAAHLSKRPEELVMAVADSMRICDYLMSFDEQSFDPVAYAQETALQARERLSGDLGIEL